MRSLQRMVLIVGAVLFILLGTSVACQQREEKFREQWEQVLMDRVLKKIRSTGKFTFVEYQQLHTGLETGGTVTGIEIEEFRKEQDISGRTYYYLVSSEELEKIFLSKGYYMFEEESLIRIRINQKKRSERQGKTYWDIVVKGEN